MLCFWREIFKEALTIMEFWKVADCEIARASYMFSVALTLQGGSEAGEWAQKAETEENNRRG